MPSETNSSIQKWNEPHYVSIPDSTDQKTDTLWVFLPGTRATPDFYTVFNEETAKTGLHAICLRYPNDRSINIQICPYDKDNDCHEKARKEIVTGELAHNTHVADKALQYDEDGVPIYRDVGQFLFQPSTRKSSSPAGVVAITNK